MDDEVSDIPDVNHLTINEILDVDNPRLRAAAQHVAAQVARGQVVVAGFGSAT